MIKVTVDDESSLVLVQTDSLCCVKHTGGLIASVIDQSCRQLHCTHGDLIEAVATSLAENFRVFRERVARDH